MARKNEKGKESGTRAVSTPLSRLGRTVGQLARSQRVLEARFRAWSSSGDPQVKLGSQAAAELGGLVERFSDVVQVLMANGFVPPKVDQYRPPEEGERVRIASKYRDRYAEKCADQLRVCPTLFDDLSVAKVYPTSKTVLVSRSPYAPFEARRSHLLPARRGAR